jgi:serine/threonine protein kinase
MISGWKVRRAEPSLHQMPVRADVFQAFQIGQNVGPYRIEGLLGSGGMGLVYLAHDRGLKRTVAIKVVDPARHDATALRALVREARLAAALSHPGICGVHEVRHLGQEPLIVMEHVKGAPLSSVIQGTRPLPFETAVHYALQIVDAVGHAHHHEIVHGDLKSSNIMIEPSGRVKILDFGLAVQRTVPTLTSNPLEGDTTLPAVSSSCAGTVPYMAPELLRGRPADIYSDIWALGIVFFEMLTGSRPFRGHTVYELAAAILANEQMPLSPSLLPAVRRVIGRCLRPYPADRHRSVHDLALALEDLQ